MKGLSRSAFYQRINAKQHTMRLSRVGIRDWVRKGMGRTRGKGSGRVGSEKEKHVAKAGSQASFTPDP